MTYKDKSDKLSFDDYEQKFDKIFLENFKFLPSSLDVINNSLRNTCEIIHNYLETIHASDELREKIFRLSMEADILCLDVNELYTRCTALTAAVKRKCLLDEKINIQSKEADEMLKKFEDTRQKILILISKTREYVQKISKIH